MFLGMSISNWAGIALVVAVIWKIRSDKIDFDDILINNTISVFKWLQAASTAIEVGTLSFLAVNAGRMGLFEALGRFGLMGLLEVLTTLLFITVFQKAVKIASEDRVVTMLEGVVIFLKSFPLWFLAFGFTNQIHNAYFESINLLELQSLNTPGMFYTWFPFFDIHLEKDVTMFSQAMIDPMTGDFYPQGRKEFSALVVIYATPILNILMVVFEIMRLSGLLDKKGEKKSVWGKFKGLFKKDPIDKSKTSSFKKLSADIDSWFGLKGGEFDSWISDYIGLDMKTGKKKIVTNTHPDVKNKKMKPLDVMKEVTEKLLGKGNGDGFNKLKTFSDDLKKENDFMENKIKDFNSDLEKYEKGDADKKKRLKITMKGHVSNIESSSKKLQMLTKSRFDLKEDLIKTLHDLNFNNAVNETEEVEQDAELRVHDAQEIIDKYKGERW